MADAIVINKADGDNLQPAKLAQIEFKRALHLYPKKASNWEPKVSICSAIKNEGIEPIWQQILLYFETTLKNNYFYSKRIDQNKYWLIQTIESQLKTSFFNKPGIQKELEKQLQLIETNQTSPFAAADYLLNFKS
jgi:LAO/AO transport system kinase